MNFSLIICTFQRPEALANLIRSLKEQVLIPNEILVIDGSFDDSTKEFLKDLEVPDLLYFKVGDKDRGLTNQRNFGISKVSAMSEVICFLDDDVVLQPDYFKELIKTYEQFPDAIGVGGYILEEVEWKKNATLEEDEYIMEGWSRKMGSRNVLRKKFGLLSDKPPGYMPEFSNGLSISFLPPSGKIYPVEFFMGGVASYRRDLFTQIQFSSFFQGYGLYEDMDFCLRASEFGQLYVNTAAGLYHYHEAAGRPNQYHYGKMVIRNGWYVWRVKYPDPHIQAKVKWHSTALLLTLVRLGNILNTPKRKEAFTESMGRIVGCWSLLWDKPKTR